jgi:hypothetical protein
VAAGATHRKVTDRDPGVATSPVTCPGACTATVVGATVVGATDVGATDVGATVVGAAVVVGGRVVVVGGRVVVTQLRPQIGPLGGWNTVPLARVCTDDAGPTGDDATAPSLPLASTIADGASAAQPTRARDSATTSALPRRLIEAPNPRPLPTRHPHPRTRPHAP